MTVSKSPDCPRHGLCGDGLGLDNPPATGNAVDTVYWTASIFLWFLFTGIGIPPIPEEAGILYAAGVTAVDSAVP